MNISDQATRVSYLDPRVAASSGRDKVIGALLGVHQGRVLEIAASFEMKLKMFEDGRTELDTDYLSRKSASSKNHSILFLYCIFVHSSF